VSQLALRWLDKKKGGGETGKERDHPSADCRGGGGETLGETNGMPELSRAS